VVLITTMFIVFAVGMMLFGFVFLMQNEAGFAGSNRNSTLALGLAEAGIQEALGRLTMFGATPGTTTFTNSLAAATPGSSGTVAYQATFQNNPSMFPIRSKATVAGMQRTVRIFEQAVYKSGLGNVIFGGQVSYQGDSSPIVGDTYAQGSIQLSQYQQTPLCATGATATNLVSPQLTAGTTIETTGMGANITPPCGSPINSFGLYTFECANGSTTEVAPTPCPGGRAVVGGYTLPFHWHPMTPIGMTSGDFTRLITWINANPATAATYQLATVQAAQNGVGVTYAPAGAYLPSYWSSIPTTNTKVMLVTAGQPFCVNPGTGAVTQPSPAITGTCAGGTNYYGNQLSGTAHATRFLDWGLVTDDLGRGTAQTFFQPWNCSTCKSGGPDGYQNGIRYIPIPPVIDILGHACTRNVPTGTNVFDKVNAADGIFCSNPPTQTISTTNVTFTGTKTNPESLVIDNAGMGTVQLSGSLPGTDTMNCSNTNFDNYNWGMILATGDISIPNKFVFTGIIYTSGTVTSTDTTLIHGSIHSAQGSRSVVNVLASTGFCPGSPALVLSPVFFNFTTVSWQDVPLNKQ